MDEPHETTLMTQVALLQWQVAHLAAMMHRVFKNRMASDKPVEHFLPAGAAAEMLFGKERPVLLAEKLRRVAETLGARIKKRA